MRGLSLNDDHMEIDNIRYTPIELIQGENGEIMIAQKKR